MSLENVIVDMTNAVRENTDAINKLILISEGNTNGAEAAPKPATKAEVKKPPTTITTKKSKKAPSVKTEEPEAEQEGTPSDTPKVSNEDKYKHLQSCLIKLSGVYAEQLGSKPKGLTKAKEFMLKHTSCKTLAAITIDQYDEFAQQLELELGE